VRMREGDGEKGRQREICSGSVTEREKKMVDGGNERERGQRETLVEWER